jgi:hypothetical protein
MINKKSFLGIPLARRRTRRWMVVGYWALVLALLGLVAVSSTGHHRLFSNLSFVFVWLLVLVAQLLGGTGTGGPVRDFEGRPAKGPMLIDNTIKTLIDSTNRDWQKEDRRLDERDIRERNAAHYKAYRIVVVFIALTSIALVYLENPDLAWLSCLRMPVLWLLLIVAFSLPQTLILWSEPDMEPADEGSGSHESQIH